MTSNVNNQGIAHLSRDRAGGPPVCNSRRAHITVTRDDFKRWRQCKRCAATLAKWEARKTKR